MRSTFLTAALLVAACSDQTNDPARLVPADDPQRAAPAREAEPNDPPVAASAEAQEDPANDAPPMAPASMCSKQLTAIFTVGVPGLTKIKTNGCWKPVISDGAATKTFRKCSTSTFKVTNNPDAANWAYDDTNPTHNATTEANFFKACSDGATGDGYVFMAYNSGWRVLTTAPVKAYFAELYTSTLTDIDSHFGAAGVYTGNATLAKHTNVYPMMNFGPPASANLEKKVGFEAAKLCATVKDGGYFGLYNASWQSGMAADDPRLLAVEDALDTCTAKTE